MKRRWTTRLDTIEHMCYYRPIFHRLEEVMMGKHTFVHIELSADDLQSAAEFYRRVFGWQTQDMPEMNYITFDEGGGLGGGFNPTENEGNEAGDVVVYIGTDDIEDSLAEIEAAGGQTVLPKTEIAGMGWFALFSDPTGNKLGLYTGQG
jgi:predicted enzyme related to lactoylglutathione lyase